MKERELIQLLLSLFPGIDLLGLGFELEGFSVVRSPDLIFGRDIRDFSVPAGRFDGVIGGAPCQEFSRGRNGRLPTGYGLEMLREFGRLVMEAQPKWFLLENVERVPDLKIGGYNWQRLDVWAHEFGLTQRRLRHFQFGSREGKVLVMARGGKGGTTAVVTASDSDTPWDKFCIEQGLPPDFDLPSFTQSAKRRAVGNGVPVPMARAMAKAVIRMVPEGSVNLCGCKCGRPVSGKKSYARGACRMRMSRRRHSAGLKSHGQVTIGAFSDV